MIFEFTFLIRKEKKKIKKTRNPKPKPGRFGPRRLIYAPSSPVAAALW
jgi:hypothetical protein